MKTKENKAITLVSLVVTIIILIILASISIAALNGKNGLITKTKEAKVASEKASIIEEIKLEIASKETEKLGDIEKQEVSNILSKYGNISSDGKTLVTNEKKYEIDISSIYSGDIESTASNSRNIWNESEAIHKYGITNTGEVVENDIRKISPFIEIKDNTDAWVTTSEGVVAVCIYDSSQKFLNQYYNNVNSIKSFGIPKNKNAKYIRILAIESNNEIIAVIDYQSIKPIYTELSYESYNSELITNTVEEKSETESKTIETSQSEKNSENPLSNIIKDGGMMNIFQTIGVVGDSLSSGCMETRNSSGNVSGVDMYQYSWIQYIARITGNKAFNFSTGGLKTKTYFTTTSKNVRSITDADKKCQAYFIALGVNDIADTSINVGTSADISNESSETFYGYYSRIIKQIQEIQPQAKIFLVGLPKHDDVTKWGKRFTNFKNAIADMPNHFSNCYYLDLYNNEVAYDSDFKTMYFNGFHENAMGYLRSAWVISTYVDWIIKNNYKDFREVQFIGTGYHYY